MLVIVENSPYLAFDWFCCLVNGEPKEFYFSVFASGQMRICYGKFNSDFLKKNTINFHWSCEKDLQTAYTKLSKDYFSILMIDSVSDIQNCDNYESKEYFAYYHLLNDKVIIC